MPKQLYIPLPCTEARRSMIERQLGPQQQRAVRAQRCRPVQDRGQDRWLLRQAPASTCVNKMEAQAWPVVHAQLATVEIRQLGILLSATCLMPYARLMA